MKTTEKTQLPHQLEIDQLAQIQVEQSNKFNLSIAEQIQFFELKYHYLINEYYEQKSNLLLQKVELVNLMFDVHSHSKGLPTSIQQQINMLKVIVLKCSLLHLNFFNNPENPVVDYLQSISQYIKQSLTPKNEPNFQHLLTKSINALISEFQSDSSIFATQLKKQLASFKHVNRANLKITQPVDDKITIHCKLALKKIYRDKNINTEITSFLDQVWSKVLVHEASKTGVTSKEYEQALKVAHLMIWSLDDLKSNEDKKHFLKRMPILFKSLSNGLNKINEFSSYFQHISDVLTKEHARLFNLWFSSSVNKAKNSATIDQSSDNSIDTLFNFSRELKQGDWLLLSQSKQQINIKLIWKAADHSEFIFVDSKGVKVKQCSLQELVADLNAKIILPMHNTSQTSLSQKNAQAFSVLKTID